MPKLKAAALAALACLASIASSPAGAAPAGAAPAGASRTVYVIRGAEVPSHDPWTANVLPAEAARLFAPSAFRKAGGTVEIELSAEASFSIGPARELERSKDKVLLSFDVSAVGTKPLPKADKTVKLRFSLADAVAAGGPAAGSPGFYALKRAVESSPYASGTAWIKEIEYDGAGRFAVTVAIRKAR